jgi:DNA-binding transcriptional ArsR family regulator
MDAELLDAMKALSDASRLRIVGLLAAGRPLSGSELSERLGLSPGTVVHHLKRLTAAGLVESRARPPYVDYSLRVGRLAELGAQLDALERQRGVEQGASPGAPAWASREQAKVLSAFREGERLAAIPAQLGKRLVVLRWLVEAAFDDGVEYAEKEVNARLALRHPDVAALRRYLVDEGFMARAAGVYRRRPAEDWPL